MNAAAPAIDRDAKGRFRAGCSGNPAGKKTGTRNRATLLKEALRDGEDTAVARIVIDKALAGDAVAARFLLERLEPKPRGRPIHLEIPEGESPAGEVVATFNAALRAMAAGRRGRLRGPLPRRPHARPQGLAARTDADPLGQSFADPRRSWSVAPSEPAARNLSRNL